MSQMLTLVKMKQQPLLCPAFTRRSKAGNPDVMGNVSDATGDHRGRLLTRNRHT